MNALSPSICRFILLTAACFGLACAVHNAAAQTATPAAGNPSNRTGAEQTRQNGPIVTTYTNIDNLPPDVKKALLQQQTAAARSNTPAGPAPAPNRPQPTAAAAAPQPTTRPNPPEQRIPPNIKKARPNPDNGTVTTYDYQPDQIYTVRAGLGITTEIELSPSEKILDYSTGFSSGWDLTRRDNVFYLKPKNVDVDTNMMIRTETHEYIFELKVVATDWRTLAQARRAGVQYHIRFTYPADAAFAKQTVKTEQEPELSTRLLKDRRYNFDYDYATGGGSAPWLIPVNAWDDGRFTYIKMPDLRQFPTGNFPSVYMRQSERSPDSLVNTTVRGNTIIVHGTYNYLVLRHDDNVVALRRNTAQPTQGAQQP